MDKREKGREKREKGTKEEEKKGNKIIKKIEVSL